jgi:hypothetical protein
VTGVRLASKTSSMIKTIDEQHNMCARGLPN